MIIKQKNATFAVLDVGNSKVICIIATQDKSQHGKVIIKGIGYNLCSGFSNGIVDINELSNSIVNAVETAENKAGEKVHALYVSISANNLLLQKHSHEITIIGREINDKDISKLVLNILDKYQEQPLEILHTFVHNYTIDGYHGVLNPLGLYANSLACELYVLSTPSNSLINMTKCITNSGHAVERYVASTYATSLSSISEEEKRLGVTMIEFGSRITTVTIFDNGNMIYTDSVPFGSTHITNDIAKCLNISISDAEKIKILHGRTIVTDLESNKNIEIIQNNPGNLDDRANNTSENSDNSEYIDHGFVKNDENSIIVSQELLIEIIRARVEEILSLIRYNLESNKMRIRGSIVITGGGAKMNGMSELINHFFSKKVRVGHIRNEYKKNIGTLDDMEKQASFQEFSHENKHEYDYHSLEFATSIGMLIHIIETQQKEQKIRDGKSRFRALIDWLKSMI